MNRDTTQSLSNRLFARSRPLGPRLLGSSLLMRHVAGIIHNDVFSFEEVSDSVQNVDVAGPPQPCVKIILMFLNQENSFFLGAGFLTDGHLRRRRMGTRE